MSGLALLNSIGKSALQNQQYSVNVTAHNISNVHTTGYSRQTATQEAKNPIKLGSLVFGQGIGTGEIKRNISEIVNNRLNEHSSSLSMFT